MKGAIAEPSLKTIIIPNKAKTIIMGNNQYFFLTFKNSTNSVIKEIINIFHFLKPMYILKKNFIQVIYILYIHEFVKRFFK